MSHRKCPLAGSAGSMLVYVTPAGACGQVVLSFMLRRYATLRPPIPCSAGDYIIGDTELRGAKAMEGLATGTQYSHVGGSGQGLRSLGAGPSASSGGVGGSGSR